MRARCCQKSTENFQILNGTKNSKMSILELPAERADLQIGRGGAIEHDLTKSTLPTQHPAWIRGIVDSMHGKRDSIPTPSASTLQFINFNSRAAEVGHIDDLDNEVCESLWDWLNFTW